MAVTQARLSIYTQDASGRRASIPFHVSVDNTQTMAEQVAEAVSLGALVDALTDSQIVGLLFGMYLTQDDSWKAAPVTGADAHFSALVAFRPAGENFTCPVVIPAINRSKIVGGQLDLADVDVAAFITHLSDAGGPYVYRAATGDALGVADHTRLLVRKWGPVRRKPRE